jgi:signal transduction histidine kinase
MDRQKGQFSFITTKEGLPNNRIDGLLVDSDDCIWVSTNYGLARYNPQTGQIKKYEKTNGLQSNEFLRGSFYKSKDGMMYFGGAKGFNLFDPQRLSGSSQKPKILLTEFRKFNNPIRFDKSLNQLEEIELSYYDNHFSFEFIALDYSNPAKSQYAYKLEGFDPDWINSGSRRFASYTNLNPGSYTFRVKAANSEGIWNNEGISIALVITPPFWMTWWFYPLLTLVIASILWGLHIRRLRVKVNHTLNLERIRISEREMVREELARDFHDELGHKLTRITVFVRRLRKHLNGAAKNIIDDLNNVSETSSDLRIGAKDLIWTLKPDEDSLYDLTIRLKDFGDDLFDGTDIKFLGSGISDNLKKYNLPMEWKRHLVLIFKEAMNNSLKYAGCMNVELSVNVVNKTLTMSLCDDGVGFESADQSNGYGINNIRTRAKKINGDLKVNSIVGEGTTIKFVAEIPNRINEKVI